jgi:hypothetical protein
MHQVWRSLERLAHADRCVREESMAVTRSLVVRQLVELIAALDRRVPQVQRVGEAAIAREAAALKARALRRIEEIERDAVR